MLRLRPRLRRPRADPPRHPRQIRNRLRIRTGEPSGDRWHEPWPVEPQTPPSGSKLVQGIKHRIAGLDAVADELTRRKDEVEEEDAEALVEALRAVLEELEGAFG